MPMFMHNLLSMLSRPIVTPNRNVLFFIGITLSVVHSGSTFAQSSVSWDARAEYFFDSARIVLEGVLPKNDPNGGPWRMYALDSPPPSRALNVRLHTIPDGLTSSQESYRQLDVRSGFDPYFDKVVTYFHQRAVIWGDYSVDENFMGGEISGVIEFMICNQLICLPPDSTTIQATFTEVSSPLPDTPVVSALPLELTSLNRPLELENLPPSDVPINSPGGLWGFILLAIGAGMGALLMPCIYPMIPMTVSFFGNHALKAPIPMALLYGFAIVVTFTGLGVGLSILLGSAGAYIVSSNPWVNVGIGIAFLVFGLSLLGAFNLGLPPKIANWFDRKGSERQDYIGILFLGLALTLVSFTCTVPFVGLLLPSMVEGDWFYGILGMAVFSSTFALPFVAFACFPKALKKLPGSGRWMREIAVVFGFIEIAAAIKFFSNADLVWGLGFIDRSLAIALWIVLSALTGLYLIGHLPLLLKSDSQPIGALRLMCGVLFFGLSVYLLPGLFGGRLGWVDSYLPPREQDTVSFFESDVEHQWITDDLPGAFSESVLRQQPLFIDFSGYTCTNCRGMEVNVIERGEVRHLLADHFVLSRLYTDGPQSREFQSIQQQLTGTLALPTYAIMDGSAREYPLAQLSGVVSSEQFRDFLHDGLAKYDD